MISHLFDEMFIERCVSMTSKPIWRNTLDAVIFFTLPALASGCLYFKVIRNLLKQEKRVGRNKALSVAFVLSWVLWILCWVPNYVFGYFGVTTHGHNELSYGPKMDKFLGYFFSLKTSIQILYSQLNVLIYVIVLKKFQDCHVAVFRTIYTTLLCRPVCSKDSDVTNEGQRDGKQTNGSRDEPKVEDVFLFLIKSFKKVCPIISGLSKLFQVHFASGTFENVTCSKTSLALEF